MERMIAISRRLSFRLARIEVIMPRIPAATTSADTHQERRIRDAERDSTIPSASRLAVRRGELRRGRN